ARLLGPQGRLRRRRSWARAPRAPIALFRCPLLCAVLPRMELHAGALRIDALPTTERPRERLRGVGAQALSVRELLAVIIGTGGRAQAAAGAPVNGAPPNGVGRSAFGIAADLVRVAGGSLRRLAALELAELEAVPGVGPAIAARVAAALELGRRLAKEGPSERPRIRMPADVYELCAPSMRDLRHEEFRALLLNARREAIREVTITRGVLDGSLVHPREVFRAAIAESASALILVHNHPSGDPAPSPDDRAATKQICAAGDVVGIDVLDHIIIGDGRFVSFAEQGWLQPPTA
ncbi:MAG: RadC family protein, partial [Longimicrobiales bacterium]